MIQPKPKVYIAAPFFTDDQLKRVTIVEEALDLMEIEYFSPRSGDMLSDVTGSQAEKQAIAKKIFESNVEHIERCNILLAILDERDTGTTFELGYAVCFAKILAEDHGEKYTIITMNLSGKGLNVMLRECVDTHITQTLQFHRVFDAIKMGESPLRVLDQGDIE